MEAPADLRAQAGELLKAVRAKDTVAAERFVARMVRTISHSLEIASEPHVGSETAGDKPGARLVMLGSHTGGDWDVPQTADGKPVDIGAFLTGMEFDFIEQSLTDGRPWGADPAAKGAICTYTAPSVDRPAVRRAAKRLGVESSVFREPAETLTLLAEPRDGADAVATLSPGRLYAIDYDAGEPSGWSAIHLPKGGTGFVKVGADGPSRLRDPYVSGLCFAATDGVWQIVAQTSTGL